MTIEIINDYEQLFTTQDKLNLLLEHEYSYKFLNQEVMRTKESGCGEIEDQSSRSSSKSTTTLEGIL